MSDKFFVFSTLSCDMDYVNHAQGGADLPIELPPVRIKGGAGVMNDRIVTPRGVVTEVTEEQLEYLRGNEVFRLHEKNGFVKISGTRADPDAVAADMAGRDYSAPLVPQDDIAPEAEMIVGGEAQEAAEPKRGRPRKS